MKTKILSAILVVLLGVSMFVLTGCVKVNNAETPVETKQEEKVEKIDDNSSYFVKVKGQTFKAGDKIADLTKVGIKQNEKSKEEKVKKNTYVIGAGTMYNENDKRVFSMTPYNATDAEITVKDAVIGGFEAGEVEYAKIPQEVLDLNIEVVGGIKFGDSLETVKAVLGEESSQYHADSLGYTSYTFKSKQVYRSYDITIDKEGKVSKIGWQNLVFNKDEK